MDEARVELSVRSAQPCWCIRHDMSPDTMYCAPASTWSRTLSCPIRTDTGFLGHRERAAEAAAFVGARRRDELDALHAFQQGARLGKRRPGDLRRDASFRCRIALQLLCSPTRCGNSAHGNSAHLQHVVQEFGEFERARAHLAHGGGLLDRREMLAHMMHATRRRPDDVVVIREIAREHALGAGRFLLRAAVRHRLAAAGLLLRDSRRRGPSRSSNSSVAMPTSG